MARRSGMSGGREIGESSRISVWRISARLNLTRENLDRANLDGALLYAANLTAAAFTWARLSGADLTRRTSAWRSWFEQTWGGAEFGEVDLITMGRSLPRCCAETRKQVRSRFFPTPVFRARL